MVNHKEILQLKSLGLIHREIADAASCGRHAPFLWNGCTIPEVTMHHHLRSSCTFGAAYACRIKAPKSNVTQCSRKATANAVA